MNDDQQFVLDSFYESSWGLNYKIQCLRHGQLLYTSAMLNDIRGDERPDLFTWEKGKGRVINRMSEEKRKKVLKEIDDKIAAHDVVCDSYDPGKELSPSGLKNIMDIYDESFFHEMDDGVREQLYDVEFAKEVGRRFKCLTGEWEKLFITLRHGWIGGFGGYKAEYACRLMNDIFSERIRDIDHKVDVVEYRRKVEDFNYAMAELAEKVRQTDNERTKLMAEVIDSDPGDYFEDGRHVIKDVFGEDEIIWWSEEEFEKPGQLYYIQDSKDPHGIEGRMRVYELREKAERENIQPQRVSLAQVEKCAGKDLYLSLHRGGAPKRVVRPAFTQKAVAVLCGRTEDTVANWEREDGGTNPPCNYRKELRVNGGPEFFDFVAEYRRQNECNDNLRDFLRSRVQYKEGLTEREAGFVDDYLKGMKP